MAAVCERECAVTVLAGAQACPVYRLPCWLCIVLHILTGTLRSVTEDRFDRFRGFVSDLWDHERDRSNVLGLPSLVCPHHPAAMTEQYERRHGKDSYWHHAEASLTTTPVTPAGKVSDGTFQARQVS